MSSVEISPPSQWKLLVSIGKRATNLFPSLSRRIALGAESRGFSLIEKFEVLVVKPQDDWHRREKPRYRRPAASIYFTSVFFALATVTTGRAPTGTVVFFCLIYSLKRKLNMLRRKLNMWASMKWPYMYQVARVSRATPRGQKVFGLLRRPFARNEEQPARCPFPTKNL